MNGRPLLVLDLDETLWYGTETVPGGSFQLRPYLGEFLRGVTQHYDLAVWTVASQDWMMAGLNVIRDSTGFNLADTAVFLWDNTRCTQRRSETGDYEWRKPARKFRAAWIRALYPRQRILALDDLPTNYACGYGHLVRISSWTGEPQDSELQQLLPYLVSIAQTPDFTVLEKRGWRSRAVQGDSTTLFNC